MNTKKRRFSNALNQHWTQKHGKHVPKKPFRTIDECLKFMTEHNINQDLYHPYICQECGMWHIGHLHQHKHKRK